MVDFPREILRAHRATHENISLQWFLGTYGRKGDHNDMMAHGLVNSCVGLPSYGNEQRPAPLHLGKFPAGGFGQRAREQRPAILQVGDHDHRGYGRG